MQASLQTQITQTTLGTFSTSINPQPQRPSSRPPGAPSVAPVSSLIPPAEAINVKSRTLYVLSVTASPAVPQDHIALSSRYLSSFQSGLCACVDVKGAGWMYKTLRPLQSPLTGTFQTPPTWDPTGRPQVQLEPLQRVKWAPQLSFTPLFFTVKFLLNWISLCRRWLVGRQIWWLSNLLMFYSLTDDTLSVLCSLVQTRAYLLLFSCRRLISNWSRLWD